MNADASMVAKAVSKGSGMKSPRPSSSTISALWLSVASSDAGAFSGAITRMGWGSNVRSPARPPSRDAASTALAITA